MLRILNFMKYLMDSYCCVFSVENAFHLDCKPPANPPNLPLELWLEIFQFATYVHQDVSIKPLNPFTPKQATTCALGANTPSLTIRTKLALVQVCRDWRRLALSILYQYIVIRSPSRANIILKALQSSSSHKEDVSKAGQQSLQPGYGQHVRHIEVFTFTRGSKDIKYLQVLFQILRLCPGLRILSGRWIHSLPTEFLDALTLLLGSTLSELSWSERQFYPIRYTNTSLQFINSFQALRVLDLRQFIGIESSAWPKAEGNLCLPLVDSLIISATPRSLDVSTRFKLPALRDLTLFTSVSEVPYELIRSFLKAHGKTLSMINLSNPSVDSEPVPDAIFPRPSIALINPDIFLDDDVCPNLESIVFSINSTVPQSCAHRNLRRIGLRGIYIDNLYHDKSSSAKNHLMSLNSDKYPKLQIIQAVGLLVEANLDSLAKDVFIWWVEMFEAMNILLLDGEGVMWAYHPDSVQDVVGIDDSSRVVNSTTTLEYINSSEHPIPIEVENAISH